MASPRAVRASNSSNSLARLKVGSAFSSRTLSSRAWVCQLAGQLESTPARNVLQSSFQVHGLGNLSDLVLKPGCRALPDRIAQTLLRLGHFATLDQRHGRFPIFGNGRPGFEIGLAIDGR